MEAFAWTLFLLGAAADAYTTKRALIDADPDGPAGPERNRLSIREANPVIRAALEAITDRDRAELFLWGTKAAILALLVGTGAPPIPVAALGALQLAVAYRNQRVIRRARRRQDARTIRAVSKARPTPEDPPMDRTLDGVKP